MTTGCLSHLLRMGSRLQHLLCAMLTGSVICLALPINVMAIPTAPVENVVTDYFRVYHTVEYVGTNSQFRTQTTSTSKCVSRKNENTAEYELTTHTATLVGNHKQPMGAKFDTWRISRDPKTELLKATDKQASVPVDIMNKVMRQVRKGSRVTGNWKQDISLGISRYMPDKIKMTFNVLPLEMKGIPDVLSVAVVSEPFSFESLEKEGPGKIHCLFKAVFIYSGSQDRLYQMGSTLTAGRGKESVRMEYMAVQCDEAGKKIIAPVVDLAKFLDMKSGPLSVVQEAVPPFWTHQVCQGFQVVAMAAATAGERATNPMLAVAQVVNAMDGLWGAAASVISEVGAATGSEQVEAWGKAMDHSTPSKEIERHLAEIYGAKDAETLMATMNAGSAYISVAIGDGLAAGLTLGNVATVVGVGMLFAQHVAVPAIDAFWAKEKVQSDARFEEALKKAVSESDAPRWNPPPKTGGGTEETRTWATQRASQLKEAVVAHPYAAAGVGVGLGTVALVAASGGGGGGGGGSGSTAARSGSYRGPQHWVSAAGTITTGLLFTIDASGNITGPYITGTCSGNSVTATANIPVQGAMGVITYRGTISGNTITGTLDGGYFSGTFELTKIGTE